MSFQVPTTFVTTFENNMKLSLQQTQSVFARFVKASQMSGELSQLDDLIGHTKSQKGDDRHGDTKYVSTPHDRVWIGKPLPDYYADLVDRDDQVQAKIALTSGYMMTATGTINRAWDDAFIAGFYGSMQTGKNGTTLVPFPSANVVPVDVGSTAPTRMNIAKLRAARKVRAKNYNDMNERAFMVLTAEQIDDLLQEMPATSRDFAGNGGEIRDGKLARLMGFELIEAELGNPLFHNVDLTVDPSGYRKTPFWTESGMRMGYWGPKVFTSIDRLPQKRHSTQIYAETTVAATRTESGKVGYILNSEA